MISCRRYVDRPTAGPTYWKGVYIMQWQDDDTEPRHNNDPLRTYPGSTIRTRWYVYCADKQHRIFRPNTLNYQVSARGYIKYKQFRVSGTAVWTDDGWYFVPTGIHANLLPMWDVMVIEYWGDDGPKTKLEPLTEEQIQGLVD